MKADMIRKKSRLKIKLKMAYKARGMSRDESRIRLYSFFRKHNFC